MHSFRPLRSNRRGDCSEPRGFTLLELLVAMSLSVILISAIYGSIAIYVRVSNDDRTVLERSRLARALFRQMSLDIQSVVFRPPEAATEEDPTVETEEDSGSSSTGGSSTGGSSSGGSTSSGDEGFSIEVENLEDQSGTVSVGLLGDSQKLVLHVSRPSRDLGYTVVSAAGLGARSSDLQSITWFLADPSAGGMEGAVGRRATQGEMARADSTGPQGLARLAGDEFAVNFADLESDEETLAAQAELLAPEVVAMEFEYFDGLSWLPEWDSMLEGRLPNAVAITLGFRQIMPEEQRQFYERNRMSIGDVNGVVEYRRHVVSLPLAEPVIGGL